VPGTRKLEAFLGGHVNSTRAATIAHLPCANEKLDLCSSSPLLEKKNQEKRKKNELGTLLP
jgi:hypothetical protein